MYAIHAFFLLLQDTPETALAEILCDKKFRAVKGSGSHYGWRLPI